MSEMASLEDREAIVSAARCAGLTVPPRPRLAPWVVAVDLGDDRLQLRSAQSAHTLAHPLLIRVFRAIERVLDGQHTVDQIVASVDADVLPTTTVFLLKLLHGRGLLQAGDGDGHGGPAAEPLRRFLGHFVADTAAVASSLAAARVGLLGSTDLRRRVASELASIGVTRIVEPAGSRVDDVDLIVACADSMASACFEEINARCLEDGTRWLRVAVCGTSAQLGPTVIPRETACYTCFERRLMTHQQDLNGYLAYRASTHEHDDAGEGSLDPLRAVLAGQAAMEVMRLVTGFAPAATIGRYCEWNAVSPGATAHDVLKVPRCPSCSRLRFMPQAWHEVPFLLAP